jgi:predicted metalloprotease with PDZ domain
VTPAEAPAGATGPAGHAASATGLPPAPVVHRLDLSRRRRRLVDVTVEVPGDVAGGLRLVVPTWTPGSYVVRDHVRHLRSISATGPDGVPVGLRPDGVSAWRVAPDAPRGLRIRLEWYADERTIRTTHVDERHALIVGAATFLCVEEARERAQVVVVDGVDEGHRIFSLLPALDARTFRAEDHDALADAAFEVGDHASAAREVDGIEHRVVWAGRGTGPDLDGLADDLVLVASEAAGVLGRPPLDHGYTVLVLDGEPGGLEHRDGTTVSLPHGDDGPPPRDRVASLLAHEYLHLWNGRRLAPSALVRPRLDLPAPTPSLWVVEGWTSYYDLLLPLRAGILDLDVFLDAFARRIDHVRALPGARVQSLREASLTAWTKHYRRDADTPNTSTDYYVHGAVAALEIDLALRSAAPDSDGLDDVLRLLWHRYGDGTGFEEEDVIAAIAQVGGDDVARRADRLAGNPGAPDPVALLGVVGIVATAEPGTDPDLGLVLDARSSAVRVVSVLEGGASWDAGIVAGDVIERIDGRAVERAGLDHVLQRGVGVGSPTAVSILRDDIRLDLEVVARAPRARLLLRPDGAADGAVARARDAWLRPRRGG